MFLNFIKNYFLLIRIKNNLYNVKNSKDSGSIRAIGLIIDESYFIKKECIISELIVNEISEASIKIIVYKDKWKKNVQYSQATFGIKHLNWNAQILEPSVREFISQKFDLLISYYDVEKAFLINVTHNSKAEFKVGFATVDKRLNHLMISTNAENQAGFVKELLRYLKLLNKI
jgi:hypothetical protein